MPIVVFVTVPSRKAKGLAQILLKKRACACVNLIKGVQSLFWWEGKIDTARETLMVIKTKKSCFLKLKKVILDNHPYSVPEIIALDIDNIHKPYYDWLCKEVHG